MSRLIVETSLQHLAGCTIEQKCSARLAGNFLNHQTAAILRSRQREEVIADKTAKGPADLAGRAIEDRACRLVVVHGFAAVLPILDHAAPNHAVLAQPGDAVHLPPHIGANGDASALRDIPDQQGSARSSREQFRTARREGNAGDFLARRLEFFHGFASGVEDAHPAIGGEDGEFSGGRVDAADGRQAFVLHLADPLQRERLVFLLLLLDLGGALFHFLQMRSHRAVEPVNALGLLVELFLQPQQTRRKCPVAATPWQQ